MISIPIIKINENITNLLYIFENFFIFRVLYFRKFIALKVYFLFIEFSYTFGVSFYLYEAFTDLLYCAEGSYISGSYAYTKRSSNYEEQVLSLDRFICSG